MSVETKQRTLGFAFFPLFLCLVFFLFIYFSFLLQVSFLALCSTGVIGVTGRAAFGTSSLRQPRVSRKEHSRAPPALADQGLFPAVLPEGGNGLLLCHAAWGSGAGSWGQPGALRGWCKARTEVGL